MRSLPGLILHRLGLCTGHSLEWGGQGGSKCYSLTSASHLSPSSQPPGTISSNPIMFTQVRFTYQKTNPPRVNSSVVFSTCPVCNPHLYGAAAHFLQPRGEHVCGNQLLSIPSPRSPWKPPVYFPSLWICLFRMHPVATSLGLASVTGPVFKVHPHHSILFFG